MPSRTTLWRHRTGRSKTKCPKGSINYAALATTMVKKRFNFLWYTCHEDTQQEIELLALEAQRVNRWAANSKGNQGCVGNRRFLRWIWRHFNQVAKNYGYYRPGTGSYKRREENYEYSQLDKAKANLL